MLNDMTMNETSNQILNDITQNDMNQQQKEEEED